MFIYKQYTQEALDRQYNNRLQVPEFATYLDQWELKSRQTEKQYPVIQNIAYGNHTREFLDVYPSPMPYSKTLIFIHGGYWQRFDKSMFQFVAGAFHHYNITTVILNYPLAPAVSMDGIVSSCRKTVLWLRDNLSGFNGDANHLYVAGHSAGAHLMAMLMASEWQPGNPGIGTEIFKGACALSGLFNLVPVQLSEVNQGLQMDASTALKNSPVLLKPHIQCPLILAVGGTETGEFKDQSRELYTCWKEIIPASLSQLSELNHFSILDALCDPTTALHNNLRQLMKV